MFAASTKPIVLALLYKEESCGYEILQRIRKVTGGEVGLVERHALSLPVAERERWLNVHGALQSF